MEWEYLQQHSGVLLRAFAWLIMQMLAVHTQNLHLAGRCSRKTLGKELLCMLWMSVALPACILHCPACSSGKGGQWSAKGTARPYSVFACSSSNCKVRFWQP